MERQWRAMRQGLSRPATLNTLNTEPKNGIQDLRPPRNGADDAKCKASKVAPRACSDAGHGGGRGREEGKGGGGRVRAPAPAHLPPPPCGARAPFPAPSPMNECMNE